MKIPLKKLEAHQLYLLHKATVTNKTNILLNCLESLLELDGKSRYLDIAVEDEMKERLKKEDPPTTGTLSISVIK